MFPQGWINNPKEVERIVATLPNQDGDKYIKTHNLMKRTENNEPVLLYKQFREVVGKDAPSGPQGIGDCVSWAWGNATNYVAALQIWATFNKKGWTKMMDGAGGLVKDARDHPEHREMLGKLEEYEECCTEAWYALSRVEVGGQRGSMQDGSVGAWAAKAASTYGTISRPYLQRKGLSPAYDKNRAKKWGAEGLPDNLEPDAKKHAFNDVVPCTSFEQARTLIRSYRPVPVCSNQGFTMTRDSKGRCRPQGTWMHAMLFIAEAENMLLCAQSWGPETPNGPLYLDQPSNTFWVDAEVADRMLRQNDSFSPAGFMGYEVEDFLTWHH